jgi:DNA-binding response OmpR family regulator
MEKTKILIVEDEFVIYDEITEFLIDNNFEVANYTKSYHEAIDQIKIFNPDIVLLDINLEGNKDGIDLGEKLDNNYHIPFIYITDFNDEVTLKRAIRTNPSHFMKKAKPNLDFNQLLIDVRLVLNNTKEKENINKQGIFVLKDYLNNMKNLQTTLGNFLSKELIEFEDISYISREDYYKNPKDNTKTKVKTNYFRIITTDNLCYFYNDSLSNILKKLPYNFVRISEHTIINISSKNLDGRINSSKISVNGKTFKISNSYKKDVEKRLQRLYEF